MINPWRIGTDNKYTEKQLNLLINPWRIALKQRWNFYIDTVTEQNYHARNRQCKATVSTKF